MVEGGKWFDYVVDGIHLASMGCMLCIDFEVAALLLTLTLPFRSAAVHSVLRRQRRRIGRFTCVVHHQLCAGPADTKTASCSPGSHPHSRPLCPSALTLCPSLSPHSRATTHE